MFTLQFVCFGGSPTRMLKFAYFIAKEINYKLPAGQDFCNISGGSDRYVLYKIGPVLSVSVSIPKIKLYFPLQNWILPTMTFPLDIRYFPFLQTLLQMHYKIIWNASSRQSDQPSTQSDQSSLST